MGLFNSGKNEKVEKVSKYERHYNVPKNSSHRRSSKHRSNQGESGTATARAMSQPPLMRFAAGYYPQANMFNPSVVTPMGGNMLSQVRYPMTPYDLSKYPSPATYATNPFNIAQMSPMNLSPVWNNGMALVNNRSVFQQPLNDYQTAAWPVMTPSNNGFMQPMQF